MSEVISYPQTIAAICILAFIIGTSLFVYLRIIIKFFLNKNLIKELGGHVVESPHQDNAVSNRQIPPILLSFSQVSYVVKKSQREILHNVYGWFVPRTITAILGTSGCGKTTLLTVLADQAEDTGQVTGTILVNGQPRTPHFRRLCAYVMQSDHFLEALTIREVLWFNAELRLHCSLEEKLQIVRKTLKDLELNFIADRRISVLSGGQKRRVTIALELVAEPSLVFLDEPTSGLDASSTLSLVKVLRKLADDGRTIICTIHQPRIDAFELFHMVYLMNAGRVIYFGPMRQIKSYFEKIGHVASDVDADANDNVADFVLDLTHGSPEDVASLATAFDESQLSKSILDTLYLKLETNYVSGTSFGFSEEPDWLPELHTTPSGRVIEQNEEEGEEDDAPRCIGDCNKDCTRDCQKDCQRDCRKCKALECNDFCCFSYPSTLWKQVFTLTRRALFNDCRNTAYLCSWVLGIVMMVFLGVLYVFVASPLVSPSEYIPLEANMNKWGACSQNFTVIGNTLGQTPAVANETIWKCGEQLNQSVQLWLARRSLLYQLLSSMFFSEMPLVAAIHQDTLLLRREHASKSYSSVSWVLSWVARISFAGFMKGLFYPPFVYFAARLEISPEPYFLFSIFMGINSVAGASVALLVAVVFGSFETALVGFVVINIISQNLCGYFLVSNFIPWWFRWYYYANFFRYTYEGTLISQTLSLSTYETALASNTLDKYEQREAAAWIYTLIAILFCVGFQLLALLALQFGLKTRFVCVRTELVSNKRQW